MIAEITERLDAMVAEIDPDRPWAHEKAAEWDTISWDAWLRAQTDDDEAVRNLAFATGSAMLTKPTHTFSLLQSLLMAASAGSYSHLVDADFILDKRVVGGLQQVPLLLAERLGDDVFLEQPVRTLEWGDDGVTAIADGITVRARFAILALAPNLYTPHLVRAAAPAAASTRCTSTSRWASSSRCTRSTTARSGASRGCPAPRSARTSSRTRRTTTPTTATSAARSSASSPTRHADDLFALSRRGAQGAHPRVALALLRPRGEEPRRLLRERLGHARSGRAAHTRRASTSAASHRYGADLRTPVGPIHFACSDLAGAGYQHVDGAIRMGRLVASHIIEEARA